MPVEIVLFIALFAMVCWHLVRSVRGLASGIATIGKPNHPRLFGIPKWKLYGGIILIVLPPAFVIGEIETRKTAIYQDALRDVRTSAAAEDALGSGLVPGWLANLSETTQGDSGHAALEVSVSGSRGKGRLYASGVEANGQWKIVDLYVIQNGSGHRIDIAH